MFDIRCLSADAETQFSLSLLINDFGIFLLPLLIPLPDPILIRKFFQIFRFFLFFCRKFAITSIQLIQCHIAGNPINGWYSSFFEAIMKVLSKNTTSLNDAS